MHLDLSSEDAITHATARALELRAGLRSGQALARTDQLWLADVACAALLLCAPTDLDLVGWLTARDGLAVLPPLPEPHVAPGPPAGAGDTRERPAWLAALFDPQQES